MSILPSMFSTSQTFHFRNYLHLIQCSTYNFKMHMLSEKKKNLTLVSVIFTVVGVSFHLILRLVLLVRA